jgi:hypothetical protein
MSGVAHAAPGIKSESRAVLFSLAGTIVPVGAGIAMAGSNAEGADDGAAAAIFCGGLIVGPSLGHFYAGRPKRALIGVGIRTVCVLGMAIAVGNSLADFSGGNSSSNDALAGVSLLLCAGSAIYDIATVTHSVRIHNVATEEGVIGLAPSLVGHAPGLRVDVRF